MRLPVDRRTIGLAAPIAAALALGACGAGGGQSLAGTPIPSSLSTGPQADYPVVVGDAYSVGGVAYTPEDVLNYDQVGYLAADTAGGSGVSASHHTLPLPSYVEVTSLETGRTILVRVERRGPMTGQELLALSDGAMAQLGAAAGTPVRVRRVNPPEEQRALLRAGAQAEARMDTPMSLVEILKRKLPIPGAPAQSVLAAAERPLPLPAASAPPNPAPAPPAAKGAPPLPALVDNSSALSPSTVMPEQAPAVVSKEGDFVVQAAAFSTSDRAENAARALGGEVSRAGRFFRVRTGPFATRTEAEASLAKVRAAGYSDARILTNG